MTFHCRQCGSCCMYMGDYIGIERETGPFEFDCVSVSTGTPFHARVDEDKRHLFVERDWILRAPHGMQVLKTGRRFPDCMHGPRDECRPV